MKRRGGAIAMRRVTLGIFAASAAMSFVGCSGSDTSGTGSTPAAAVPEMPPGPAKPSGTVAERIAAAKESAAKGDLQKAIEWLEDGLRIDYKDRESLGLLAKYLKDRAKEVASSGTTEYYKSLVSAAEYYRRLRNDHSDLTPEEKALGLEVFYDEASAHAKSLRVEETVGSLRDLVGAGFKDFDRIRNDPNWKDILGLSEFKNSFAEISGADKEKK
ncbi:MAG: hypothetical protein SFX72_06990 [Isosphaeraceae bacterium]|nr:hypothetical protein [Isosphaeraceae bacterium]